MEGALVAPKVDGFLSSPSSAGAGWRRPRGAPWAKELG